MYAVWFNMLESDDRSHWPHDLLTDRRVTHFWDEKKVVGRWFAEHPDYPYRGAALWDAYLLYGGDARWDKAPSDRISWGFSIMRTRERLLNDLVSLWKQSGTPSKNREMPGSCFSGVAGMEQSEEPVFARSIAAAR